LAPNIYLVNKKGEPLLIQIVAANIGGATMLIDKLEELLERAKKHKVPKAEQEYIYLIHHLHPPEKAADMETVHHCLLHQKKNEKGLSW